MVNIAIPEDMAVTLVELLQQAMTPKIGVPTLDEVAAYARKKNSHVSADRFFSYYTKKNWKDKDGNPLANWQSKFDDWDSYRLEKSAPSGGKTKSEILGGSASRNPVTDPDDDLAWFEQHMKERKENG